MTTSVLWEQHKPQEMIERYRFNTKEFIGALIEQVPEISLPPKASDQFLTVPLQSNNGSYFLSFDTEILKKHPNVCYVDQGKVVARLQYNAGKCDLIILDDKFTVDINCSYEGEALSIQSAGTVALSGMIKTNQAVQANCKTCYIQDNEIETDAGVEHHYTSIHSSQIILRAENEVVIDEKVRITADEQMYLSGKNISNDATLSAHEMVLATDHFSNQGSLEIVDLTGFTLDFHNTNKGRIHADHLVSLCTNNYIDDGQTDADEFYLQAEKTKISGQFKIKEKSQIITKEEIVFHPDALLENQGDFSVECDGEIQFASTLNHELSKSVEPEKQCSLRFAAGKSLNMSGFINTEKSQVVLLAKEKLTVDALLCADKRSDLIIDADQVAVNKALHQFRDAHVKAKKDLSITQACDITGRLSLEAEKLDIDTIVQAESSVSLRAATINISEKAKVLTKASLQIESDYLYNSGDVVSQTTITGGINYLTCNRGNISAQELGLDTGIYANFGSMCGESRLNINAFLSVSAGVTYAGAYQANSLFELKAGLHLTQLPALKELFAAGSLLQCSQLIGLNLLPQVTQVLELIYKTSQWVWHPIKTYEYVTNLLSGTIAQLKELATGLNSMPLHRLIVGMVKMKEMAFSAKSEHKRFSELKELSVSSLKELGVLDLSFNKELLYKKAAELKQQAQSEVQGLSAEKIVSAAKSAVASLLPGYSSDSLMHIGGGSVITARSAMRSLHVHNSAFHAAMASLSIEAKTLTNTAAMTAIGSVTLKQAFKDYVKETTFHDEGMVTSASGVQVDFKSVELASTHGVTKSDWQVKAEQCVLEGEQHLEHSRIDAKHAIKQTGHLVTKECVLDGGSVSLESADLEKSRVKAATHLQATQTHAQSTTLLSHSVTMTDSTLEKDSRLETTTGKLTRTTLNYSSVMAHEDLLAHQITAENASRVDGKIIELTASTVSHSTVVAEERLQAQQLTGDASLFHGGSVKITGAKLTDGQVRSKTLLEIQDAETLGTGIDGKNLELRDSKFKGRTTEAAEQAGATAGSPPPAPKSEELTQNQIRAEEHLHIVNTEIDTMSVDAGTMDAIESDLKKTEAKVRGTFHAKNLTTEQSRVLAGSVALEGKTKTDVDSVVLGKLQTDGPFNGSVCDSTGKVIGAVREDPKYGKLVYASNGVLVGKLGINKEVQAFSIIDSEGDFKIQGDVEGTSASFAGKNMEIDAAMTGKGRFNLYAKEQMTAKEGAGINIQALEMRAHGFDNSSKIHTTDGYELEADRFYNWWKGTFDLQGGSLFDVKQITMNSGRLNGDNMTVNTGVFANLLGWSHVNRLTINAGVFANVAGDIAGYDSLTVNAGLSLNVGLMRSLHTRTSSLVAYNTGLYLPTLPSSLSECFSWDTLFGAVKTLVHNVSPTMGSALGTAKGAYGLARSGTALYKNLRKVGKQAVNNPGSVNIGEIVGMLVGAKDLFDGANGVLGSAQKTLKPAETATGEPDASVGTLQVLSQVGMDAARQTFAPTYSSQSVYSSNSGVVASYSISERMVSGKNTGVETAVHTDIHASSYVNRGQHLTTDFRGEITHTENFGEINSVTFKLKGESYSESGSTTAQVADVELDKWQQAGGVTSFESGRMNLNHLSASSGELHLTHTQLDVKKMTQIEKEAEINVAASVVNLHQTTIDGTLTATAGTRVTVADLKNDGQKMDVLRDGSELSVGQTGSIIIEEKSALLAGKTKSDGVVSILDSVAKVVDYSASATSATTVTGTREAAAGLFSEQRIEVHGDINTSHALIEAADRVSLADDATGKIADTTARSNEVMIAAQVEIQGHNLLASKKRLDVTATSQITGEGTMSFKAPAGSLMGAFSASGAVVEIDQLEESAKDLVYGRRTYVSFQPTESLSVKTSKTMTIDQAWNRSCQVELTAAGINVDAQVDMSSGLRLETTRDSLRITADMHSRKNMELKSARDILNTGAKVIADEDLFLETVQGDLRNVGGTIQGRHYFQGIINGDVYNEAVKIKSKGKHDTLHHYTPAELLGGQREDNEVGLFIEATGRMVNDASRIQSQGHNVVHAKKGFKGRAHTHSYVAEKHKRKGWWSGEERELKSTDVFVSSMTSTHGRNFVEVEEGGIRSAASSFISKEGTDLLARDNIDLLGVPAQQQVKEKKYSWFGISKKDTSAKHDSLTPTLLFDLGRSNIHSYEGDVNAIDARMLGPGNLLMKGKNVRVATRVENHSVDAHTRSLRFDFFGLAAMNAVASGQNFVSSLLHLDPTLGKVDDFFRSSNNPAEIAAGASNVALSAYNSYQQFNPSGFNPTISVGLSDYTTHQHYQTLGPGVIQRGSLEVEAEHVFSIKDAAVDVSGDMSVKAKVFSQQGSGLESDVTSETKSISLGVTAKGGVASVSVGYQSQEGKQVAQHSQELNVGGTLTVNTASWEQDQASASVGSLVGHVDELKVVSRQSTQEETHMSGSASTTGFFSVSVSVSKSAKTTEKSGVIVRNASGSDFTVGHADLTGGTIHTDDTQGVRIERMTSHDVCDREQSYHYGLSGNVRDFIPQQSSDLAPTTETVPAVIPSVGVDFDHRDYQAIHHAGVNPTIETTVLNDGDLNLHLDVPIIYPIKKLEEDMTPPILIPAQDIAEDLKSAAEVLSPAELDSSVNESPGSSRGSIAEENPVVLPSISRISQDDNISTSEPVFELKRKIDDGFRHTISAAEPSHEGAEFEHQEESSIPKRPDIKMKTKDVKMGSKKGGGNKGQIYELKTGQYINSDGVDQRLTEKNAKRDRVTKESKIEYKKELFTGTPKIYWQTEEQLGDEINIIRPTYFNDGGRVFFVAELDTKKNEVKIKLEAGGDIRFNIAHGHNDWMDLVKTEYAVDAASVQSLLRLSASNERQLTVEVVCEAGALGPNGSCSVKTAQISLFGLTCQVEGSLKTGVGVKVAGGAGLTVDKTQLQFRPYVKAGAFLGPGVEVTCKLSLGIDTDLPERMHKEVDRRIQTTATRTYLDQLTSLIETTTASNPSTFFGRVWKTYQIQCWEESRHECLTQIGNDAFVSTIFNVTP